MNRLGLSSDVQIPRRSALLGAAAGLAGGHYPRRDGAHRRPLLFDRALQPKPAYGAIRAGLRDAEPRDLLWEPPA